MNIAIAKAIAFGREERGAAATEFALVSVVFFTFIVGIFYVSIMIYTNLVVHWAVNDSIRRAALTPTISQSAIQTQVNAYLSSKGVDPATVTYTVLPGAIPVGHIVATLSKEYAVPLITTFHITYSADAYVPQGS